MLGRKFIWLFFIPLIAIIFCSGVFALPYLQEKFSNLLRSGVAHPYSVSGVCYNRDIVVFVGYVDEYYDSGYSSIYVLKANISDGTYQEKFYNPFGYTGSNDAAYSCIILGDKLYVFGYYKNSYDYVGVLNLTTLDIITEKQVSPYTGSTVVAAKYNPSDGYIYAIRRVDSTYYGEDAYQLIKIDPNDLSILYLSTICPTSDCGILANTMYIYNNTVYIPVLWGYIKIYKYNIFSGESSIIDLGISGSIKGFFRDEYYGWILITQESYYTWKIYRYDDNFNLTYSKSFGWYRHEDLGVSEHSDVLWGSYLLVSGETDDYDSNGSDEIGYGIFDLNGNILYSTYVQDSYYKYVGAPFYVVVGNNIIGYESYGDGTGALMYYVRCYEIKNASKFWINIGSPKKDITYYVSNVTVNITIISNDAVNFPTYLYIDGTLQRNYNISYNQTALDTVQIYDSGTHNLLLKIEDPISEYNTTIYYPFDVNLYDMDFSIYNYVTYNNTKYINGTLFYNISYRCGLLDNSLTISVLSNNVSIKSYNIVCDNSTHVISDSVLLDEGTNNISVILYAYNPSDNIEISDLVISDRTPPNIDTDITYLPQLEGIFQTYNISRYILPTDVYSPYTVCEIYYGNGTIANYNITNSTKLYINVDVHSNSALSMICKDFVNNSVSFNITFPKKIFNLTVIGPKPYKVKTVYSGYNKTFESSLSSGYLIINEKPTYFYAYAYRGIFKSNVHYDPDNDEIENVTLTLDPQFTIHYQPNILRQGVGSLFINISYIEEPPVTINITTSSELQILFPGKSSYVCEQAPCIVTVPYGITFDSNLTRSDFNQNLTGKNYYGPYMVTLNISGYTDNFKVNVIEYKWGDKIIKLTPISCTDNFGENTGVSEQRWKECTFDFTGYKACYAVIKLHVESREDNTDIVSEEISASYVYLDGTRIDSDYPYYRSRSTQYCDSAPCFLEPFIYMVVKLGDLSGNHTIKVATREIYNQDLTATNGKAVRELSIDVYCVSNRSDVRKLEYIYRFRYPSTNLYYTVHNINVGDVADAIWIFTAHHDFSGDPVYGSAAFPGLVRYIGKVNNVQVFSIASTVGSLTYTDYTYDPAYPALVVSNITNQLIDNSENTLFVQMSEIKITTDTIETTSDEMSVILISEHKPESLSIDGLVGLILPVGTDKVYNVTIKNTANHALYNIKLEYYYPDYLIEIANPVTYIAKLDPGEEVTIPLHIKTKVDHPTEYFTISIWAYADNYEWGVKHIRTRIIEHKDVLVKLECPTSVPTGARFDVRVKYLLRSGTTLRYPLVTIDWNGTAFAWRFGYLAYQQQCVDKQSLVISPSTQIWIPVFSHEYLEHGKSLDLSKYSIEKYELRIGPLENLHTESTYAGIFAQYTDNQIWLGQILPKSQVSQSIDLKPYLPIVGIDTYLPIWISTESGKSLGSFACRMGTPRGAEPSIEVILQYRQDSPYSFQPLGEYWFKIGDTINKGQWSGERVFTALAPYAEGEYTITAFVCDTLDSLSCWNATCKILAEATTSLITSLKFDEISEYVVGEKAKITGRFEVTNVGPTTIVGPVYKTITVPYAENLKVIDLSTGEIVFRSDKWSGPVTITITNVGPGETKTYSIEYEMPTVKVVDIEEYFVVEKGEKINVKQVTLQSEAPTILHKVVYRDRVDGEVTKVEIDGNELEFNQVGDTVEIDCGTFGVGERRILRIYYKKGVPPLVKGAEKVGKNIVEVLKENAVYILGSLAAILFVIFLII